VLTNPCTRIREHESVHTDVQVLTLILSLAGGAWSIPSGDFYAFRCHSLSIAIVARWLPPLGVICSLYNLGVWYECRVDNDRARALLRQGTMNLHEEWTSLLEDAINTRHGHTMNVPFELAPPIAGGSSSVGYALNRERGVCEREEFRRGGELFIISQIGKIMGGSNKLGIVGVNKRWWSKLIKWCQAQMGLTIHQQERDRIHGRPSTEFRGRRGRRGDGSDEESGSQGEEQ